MTPPTEDEIMLNANQYDQQYMLGPENRLIRYYYYLNTGLGILNQFRNLLLGIFGLYVILKLTNPLYLILFFLLSVPVLTLTGYYNVHRMNKVMEWIGLRFSSHYAIRQYNYQQGIHDTLLDIKKAMVPSSHEVPLPQEEVIQY